MLPFVSHFSLTVKMSCVLIGIFCLLSNKFSDHPATKLKGDMTDEKCRQYIVRELDDIKTKLHGLARKDLLSSIRFLKEGVSQLNLFLDECNHNQAAFAHDRTTDIDQAEASTTTDDRGSERRVDRIFNQALALSQAIATLNISIGNRFASTKLSFEKANMKATEAFSNEALSTEDRILAIKLRVISRILGSLDDPDAAAVACKVYLEELHDMKAVKKMFAVQFKGGIRSLFNKTKRVENIKSVFLINFVLFDFIKKFTTKASYLFNWPQIDLEEISMHPMTVTAENDIINEIEKSGVQAPNLIPSAYLYNVLTVNSKGEIIAWEQPSVVLINSRGDIQDFCRLP